MKSLKDMGILVDTFPPTQLQHSQLRTDGISNLLQDSHTVKNMNNSAVNKRTVERERDCDKTSIFL